MAEIIDFHAAQTGRCDLRAIDEFVDALTLVSETMNESPHANAINRLAWEIKRRGESAERRRRDLSGLVRPDRSAGT
jgi:hypothetical protein